MKRNNNAYIPIITILVFAITVFMTVGFASYGEILNSSIGVTLHPDGKFLISNITMVESNSVLSSEIPIISNDSIIFDISFSGGVEDNYITYSFDAENNSSYEYVFNSFNFEPIVVGSNGGTGDLTLEVFGINEGEVIRAGEKRTITLTLTLIPSDPNQTYDAGGTTSMENIVQEKGNVLLSTNVVDNDLTDDDTAEVEISLINTYEKAISFNVTSSNTNFVVTNGSNLSIGANNTDTFTIVLNASSDSIFTSTVASTNLIITTDSVGNLYSEPLNFSVEITPEKDNDKVRIGDVNLVMKNAVGQADVSFSRLDTGGTNVVDYTILLYNSSNNNLVNTYHTNSAITSYSITGLSAGSYYVLVYGIDEAGNTGSSDVNNASTTNEYCRKSNTVNMRWVFNVTNSLSNMTSNGASTANIGTTYTATLSANNNYSLPDNITVTMNGNALNAGGGYTYSTSSGQVSIPNVSGDISISGSATRNICLVEGTKVKLANGNYKNIEDIGYHDLLQVYNYDNGSITKEYPIWIENEGTIDEYQLTEFSDGSYLKTVGYHGIYSNTHKQFISVDDLDAFKVGTEVIKIDDLGNRYIVSVRKISYIKEKVNYYHVVSTRYYNIIANDFLTTDGTVILSNLYGFDEDIRWGKHSVSDGYTYDELNIMPYYMYIGLRAKEAKYLNNYGLNLDTFKKYLILNQLNDKMLKKPDTNLTGNRVWMVTTSDDIVTNFNINSYLHEEGSVYTLKNPTIKKGFKYWYNTGDNNYYKPGDKVKIWHGTHFDAIYN